MNYQSQRQQESFSNKKLATSNFQSNIQQLKNQKKESQISQDKKIEQNQKIQNQQELKIFRQVTQFIDRTTKIMSKECENQYNQLSRLKLKAENFQKFVQEGNHLSKQQSNKSVILKGNKSWQQQILAQKQKIKSQNNAALVRIKEERQEFQRSFLLFLKEKTQFQIISFNKFKQKQQILIKEKDHLFKLLNQQRDKSIGYSDTIQSLQLQLSSEKVERFLLESNLRVSQNNNNQFLEQKIKLLEIQIKDLFKQKQQLEQQFNKKIYNHQNQMEQLIKSKLSYLQEVMMKQQKVKQSIWSDKNKNQREEYQQLTLKLERQLQNIKVLRSKQQILFSKIIEKKQNEPIQNLLNQFEQYVKHSNLSLCLKILKHICSKYQLNVNQKSIEMQQKQHYQNKIKTINIQFEEVLKAKDLQFQKINTNCKQLKIELQGLKQLNRNRIDAERYQIKMTDSIKLAKKYQNDEQLNSLKIKAKEIQQKIIKIEQQKKILYDRNVDLQNQFSQLKNIISSLKATSDKQKYQSSIIQIQIDAQEHKLRQQITELKEKAENFRVKYVSEQYKYLNVRKKLHDAEQNFQNKQKDYVAKIKKLQKQIQSCIRQLNIKLDQQTQLKNIQNLCELLKESQKLKQEQIINLNIYYNQLKEENKNLSEKLKRYQNRKSQIFISRQTPINDYLIQNKKLRQKNLSMEQQIQKYRLEIQRRNNLTPSINLNNNNQIQFNEVKKLKKKIQSQYQQLSKDVTDLIQTEISFRQMYQIYEFIEKIFKNNDTRLLAGTLILNSEYLIKEQLIKSISNTAEIKLVNSKLYYRFDEINRNGFGSYTNNELLPNCSLLFLFKLSDRYISICNFKLPNRQKNFLAVFTSKNKNIFKNKNTSNTINIIKYNQGYLNFGNNQIRVKNLTSEIIVNQNPPSKYFQVFNKAEIFGFDNLKYIFEEFEIHKLYFTTEM